MRLSITITQEGEQVVACIGRLGTPSLGGLHVMSFKDTTVDNLMSFLMTLVVGSIEPGGWTYDETPTILVDTDPVVHFKLANGRVI